MIVKYQKKLPGVETWEDVKSLDEINFEVLPYVLALEDTRVYESPTGMHFRAFWLADDSSSEPYSPMAATLCLRLQQAELDVQYWKEQAGEVAERDARFKKVAGNLRDRIVKQLAVLATSQAEAFAGSHNERHQKLAAAMTQIPAIAALCEEIPNLLTHAANDIPF